MMKAPLLWFVLAGSALFALDMLMQDRAANTVIITAGDLQRIHDQWQAQSGDQVTPETLDALTAEMIQERRLSREAVALGLDQDDVIVQRRLAQKMRFLIESMSDDVQPTESDLAAFYASHRAAYTVPARWSFRHIFFSAESRGGEAAANAITLLAELQQFNEPAARWQSLGDPFILGRIFKDRFAREIEQTFGDSFIEELMHPEAAQWRGPLSSPFGYHLVIVDDYVPSRIADLPQARDQVLYDYRIAQRTLAYDRYLAKLAEKYPIDNQSEDAVQP